MMKSLCFLIILFVIAFEMGGCSGSIPKSTINEQSSKGILKVEDEQTSKAAETTTFSGKQESTEKVKEGSVTKEISYKEYNNDRFGFSIQYPGTFVTKMLPTNGDGIILESLDDGAELTVSGLNNVYNSTAKSYFDDFIEDHEDISFKKQEGNWFVSSWIEGDKILYMKEVIGNGSINTFLFKYPQTKKEYYDQVVNKLIKSFKTSSVSKIHGMVLDEEPYDHEKVIDLFISRFLIASKDKDNTLYALKSSPSEFLYNVHVDRFDEERNMYEIHLSRNTDTVQNFFYYDPNTEKFYNDGDDKEEITSDDNIFFWSPF